MDETRVEDLIMMITNHVPCIHCCCYYICPVANKHRGDNIDACMETLCNYVNGKD